jgi:hypothetical protein
MEAVNREYTYFSYEQCKELLIQREHDFGTEYINRELNKTHMNKIKNSMPGCLKTLPPILVNRRTKHVLDGQHRLAAFVSAIESKKMPNTELLPTRLINVSKEEETEIKRACNTNTKQWSIRDFIRNSQEVNGHVTRILEFSQNRARLLSNSGPKSRLCCYYVCGCSDAFLKDPIKLEELEITDYTLESADQLYTEITSIFEALDFVDVETNVEVSLLLIWKKRRHEFPMDKWIKGFKRKKHDIRNENPRKIKQWDKLIDSVAYYITKNV